VGLFGGAVWHTPLDGLSLSVEYDSDTFVQERAAGNLLPKSQVNYGLSYDLTDQMQTSLSWLYGTTLGGGFSLRLDPVHPQYPQKVEPPPPPVTVRSDEERLQALAALLESRDPRNVRRARLLESRNASRNDFVDALWKIGGDYTDIQVQKSTLDLTVTGTISSARCAATARLMQGVATSITRIELHDAGGRRKLACTVPRTVEGPLISAAFMTSGDLGKLPAMPVLTIDASAVAPAVNRAAIERNIRTALTAQNIFIDAVSLGYSEVLLYYRNVHYLAETDAIDRIVRVLTKEAPPQVERFRLIAVQSGVPQQEFDVLRSPVERSYQQEDGTIFDRSVRIRLPTMNQPVLAAASPVNELSREITTGMSAPPMGSTIMAPSARDPASRMK